MPGVQWLGLWVEKSRGLYKGVYELGNQPAGSMELLEIINME